MSAQNTNLLLNKSKNGEKSATWFDDDGKKRERKHAPLNDYNPYGCRAPLRCLFDSCSYLGFLLTTLHLHPFPIIFHNFFLSPSLCWAAGPLSGVRLMIRIAGQQFHPLRLLTLLNFLPIYTSLAYSATCYMLYTK